ncbi:MAG TPA: AAA family ATPase, partial [Herpetosiphonaceae bacterium]|nr:AAA family ATPase [Herpetosiphonaceae bacterium]
MHQLVPPMILDRLEAREQAGSFPAAALFVDTAGFTPLTSALMAHGAEGVEVIAAILRTVFRPLVYAVYEQGGFIAGFAGDSFKAVFPGSGDEVYARCALAAEAIRRHMAAHPTVATRFGSFDFAVKVCVAEGAVEWQIWRGDERDDGRQSAAYTFAGPALDRCMAMDPDVGGGQVAFSAAVAARLDRRLVRLEAAGPYWRLRGVDPALAAAHPPLPAAVPADDGRAAAFMPPAILRTALQGEFRQVVSMFVNLRELPPEPEARAEIYRRLFEILARHGGYLCRVGRIGAGDAGATWLLFWGAPTSVEQDLQRALSFALDLRDAVDVPLRAGITNQLAYAGFVGADLREEYTCYGTAVNLAARLMGGAGWGEIWLDQECARGAGPEFICQPQGERLFKGFAAEQPVFTLKGRQQRWNPVAYGRPLIGRAAETARLDATLAALAGGANGGLTVVAGEAGIGKSRLIYEVQRHFAVQWFYCPSDGVVRQSLYPWRYFLRRYFAQDSAQSDEENRLLFDFGIEALIEATADPALGRELGRTRSLLAALVDIYWPGSLYERLEPKGRFENTLDAIKTLVRAESLRQPLALHLEDAHWLDGDTLQFIPGLLRSVAGYPVAVIATMRPTEGHPLPDAAAQVIGLEPLDDAGIRQLAATLLGRAAPEHVSELVLARAEGNPFFAEQILLYMQEQGMLEAGADAALLPTNVWAILIARLDLLAQETKQVVQTAAVLGREFAVGVLARMLGDEGLMRHSLAAGQALAIWSEINQLRYIFRHALLRDAAYAMQLYARRRTLHQQAAETLESLYAADLRPHYAALAYHYEQAADQASTLVYLKKAAQQARDGYQNASAVGYYDRLIALLQARPDAGATLPEQIDALCQRGSIQLLTGDWPAAESAFAAARDMAAALPDPFPLARVQSLFGDF